MGQVHRFPTLRAFLYPKTRTSDKGTPQLGEVIPFPGPRLTREFDKQTQRFEMVRRDWLELIE